MQNTFGEFRITSSSLRDFMCRVLVIASDNGPFGPNIPLSLVHSKERYSGNTATAIHQECLSRLNARGRFVTLSVGGGRWLGRGESFISPQRHCRLPFRLFPSSPANIFIDLTAFCEFGTNVSVGIHLLLENLNAQPFWTDSSIRENWKFRRLLGGE